jgi:hypothetical protein
MLKFRHYTDRNLARRDFRIGILLYDRKQPTLDLLVGKHVYVVFWISKKIENQRLANLDKLDNLRKKS